MSLEVTSLTELNQDAVDQQEAILTEILQEYNPDIELKRGVIRDIVLHANAIFAAASDELFDRLRRSNSLKEITNDPELADDDTVDRVLSNYRITRSIGTKATGQITIVLSALVPVIITQGTKFTISGVEFKSDKTFSARTSQSLVTTDTDRLITALGNGQYIFNIDATASNIGTSGNVKRASNAVTDTQPNKFVKAFVTSDFTGGLDADSNQLLLNKLASGMATRTWSNRYGIESLIRAEEEFSNIIAFSIIGFGDGEMLRDQHTIWPASVGGKSDIYIRSQLLYQSETLSVTATLISKVGPVGTWQFTIARDDVPGFYSVDKVLLTTQDQTDNGFTPTLDTRNVNLTEDANHQSIPDIEEVIEGVYSRYQTAIIRFVDTVTDASGLTVNVSTKEYNAIVKVMPLVGEVQDFLSQRSVRSPMSDVCVKAAIPCFLEIEFTLKVVTDTEIDEASLKTVIADTINGLGFPGSLSNSFISQIVYKNQENVIALTDFDLTGTIRNPDGSTTVINDDETISIANDFENMVSGRTVALFLDPDDIAITIEEIDLPDL